jgi:pimeloyl-ACP methyl ester carboxylesterase
MKTIIAILLCSLSLSVYSQDPDNIKSEEDQDSLVYESKMIKTSRMNMEYMDFGGKGKALIHIQGVHNASGMKDDSIYYENYITWRDQLKEASKYYRVYSPVYRGFGNSDKEGDDIFKVENIAKDILAFMDEMNIESAVFMGRTTAPQVIFHIAETNPKRVEAIVIRSESMYKAMPIKNEEIKEFMYYCSYSATDLGDRAPEIVMPMYAYEPEFYRDSTKRLDIPLYWPYSTKMNIMTMNLPLLNYISANNSFIPNEEAKNYFDYLFWDKDRQNRIKDYYAQNDPGEKILDGLKLAFGDNLTLQNTDQIEEKELWKKLKRAEQFMMNYLVSLSEQK